jgi:hypothetical protein
MLLHSHARPPPPAAIAVQSKASARSLMDSLSSLFRRNAATPSGETKADSSVIDGQAMAQPPASASGVAPAPGSASTRFPLLATRCFGFGPPACVAGDFGGLEQHIHSFVLGDDLVPRLTTATFQVPLLLVLLTLLSHIVCLHACLQVIRDDLLLYLEKGSVAMINAVVQRNLRSGAAALLCSLCFTSAQWMIRVQVCPRSRRVASSCVRLEPCSTWPSAK